MLAGWAYGAIYRSSAERTAALDGWLWRYNHQRPHASLGRKPPSARLAELNNLGSGHRVMLVCHDALILLVRYVLEGMTEAEILDLAASTSVLNASITRYVRPEGRALVSRRPHGRYSEHF